MYQTLSISAYMNICQPYPSEEMWTPDASGQTGHVTPGTQLWLMLPMGWTPSLHKKLHQGWRNGDSWSLVKKKKRGRCFYDSQWGTVEVIYMLLCGSPPSAQILASCPLPSWRAAAHGLFWCSVRAPSSPLTQTPSCLLPLRECLPPSKPKLKWAEGRNLCTCLEKQWKANLEYLELIWVFVC